jgi:hypothetical protein
MNKITAFVHIDFITVVHFLPLGAQSAVSISNCREKWAWHFLG